MQHPLASIVTALVTEPALAGGAVAGTLATRVVRGDSLATESQWDGALAGTSRFSVISLEDLAGTRFSTFLGNLLLATPRGELIGTDTGLWNLETGEYVDVFTVTSGTGDYAGATAVIVLTGVLDPVSGHGDSRYRGVIQPR